MDMTGKTVMITGASRGIGAETARIFAQNGANVVLLARSQDAIGDLAGEIGKQAIAIPCNVARFGEMSSAVETAVRAFGGLDVLINNAGGSPPADAATASPRFSESIIRLNLIAPLVFAQKAYAAMGDGGAIVNIASISGVRPSPGTAAYGAAKAGLLNLTLSLGQEWAPRVRVNAIIAGLIKTEAADAHYGGAKGIANIEAELPMKRMAVPADIAQACLFLASPQAGYITGACLEVHGGGEPPAFLKLAEEAQKS